MTAMTGGVSHVFIKATVLTRWKSLHIEPGSALELLPLLFVAERIGHQVVVVHLSQLASSEPDFLQGWQAGFFEAQGEISRIWLTGLWYQGSSGERNRLIPTQEEFSRYRRDLRKLVGSQRKSTASLIVKASTSARGEIIRALFFHSHLRQFEQLSVQLDRQYLPL
ncbi:hypothetical protein ACFFLM_11180 [Deinococcus oregonensis]|uniref:Uncharacterized protein n=1 Tax=Deinococcus oregonensis TaxID=1805970 RepID=A0ABV6AYE5_9DEIO